MLDKIIRLYFKCARVRCANRIKGLEAQIRKMQGTLLYDAGQGPFGSGGVVIMKGLHESLERCENRYRELLDREMHYKRG